jgi:hypothetical protein
VAGPGGLQAAARAQVERFAFERAEHRFHRAAVFPGFLEGEGLHRQHRVVAGHARRPRRQRPARAPCVGRGLAGKVVERARHGERDRVEGRHSEQVVEQPGAAGTVQREGGADRGGVAPLACAHRQARCPRVAAVAEELRHGPLVEFERPGRRARDSAAARVGARRRPRRAARATGDLCQHGCLRGHCAMMQPGRYRRMSMARWIVAGM